MKKLFGALIFLFLPALSHAQCTGASPTWNSTPDQASLSSCVSKASAGDTINVSAGTVTWSTAGIATSKAISIIGAGANSTIINDAIPTSGNPCSIFRFTPSVVGSLTRISGMTLQPASGVTKVCAAFTVQGTCTLTGCPNLRVDHMTFSGWATVTKSGNSYGLSGVGDMFGVLDHNTINGDQGTYLHFVEINHGSYLGQGLYGDSSWSQPDSYGSGNFMFFENNTFNFSSCCENEGDAGGLQTRGGSRVVVRFNTFNPGLYNSNTWHGTETGGRPRGGRNFEMYANTVTCVGSVIGGSHYGCSNFIGARSGTGLGWGNRINMNSLQFGEFISFTTYRIAGNINWGACDGSGAYDTNDGKTYYSGTVGSFNSTTNTITVADNPGWAANQWIPNGAPYSVHDATKGNGTEITSNGSNTLVVVAGTGGPGSWTPVAGDTIQILRATVCMDQAGGRGNGALLSGLNTNPNLANPIGPSNQALSPAYFWANPFTGGTPSGYIGTNTARVVRNRDWYQDNLNQIAQSSPTSPFNGSSGTGYGTLANRPATCTAGTAYWATDQGTWNTTGTTIPGVSSSTQGELFICGATGWPTLPSYVPYTYPHPLVNGSSGTAGNPPNAPTGLVATVQ